MKRRTFMALLITALAVALLVDVYDSESGTTKPIQLSFASFSPPTSAAGRVSERWLNEIEKRAEGRVKFNRFWGGTLLGGKNMYEGIVGGIANSGVNVIGYIPGRFPLLEALDLPIGFPSAEVANRVIWDAYKKFKPKELADTKVLFLFACSPCSIWSKVPIRKLEDMKNLEIRATGFTARLVQALGGTPVAAPQPEVYEMLLKGIVKGTWSSLDVLKSYKQADVTKYLTINGLYVSSFYAVMNLNTFNSLPLDLQKLVDDYSDEYVGIAGRIWDGIHHEGLQYAKDRGLEIITLSSGELDRWKKGGRTLLDDYVNRMKAKELPGKEFLDELIRLKEKYSR